MSAPVSRGAVPPGEWGGLSPKEAWWAGYRVGKGLPPDMPRSEAVAAAPGASRAPEAVQGWRTIESAPKDGQVVILYRPLAHLTHDKHVEIFATCANDRGCWQETVPPGRDGKNYTDGYCYATHWMPLPLPPGESAGSASQDGMTPVSVSGAAPAEMLTEDEAWDCECSDFFKSAKTIQLAFAKKNAIPLKEPLPAGGKEAPNAK